MPARGLVAALLAATAASAALAAPAAVADDGAIPPFAERRHYFDYDPTTTSVTVIGSEPRRGALVRDIVYSAPGELPVSAYLVTPTRPGPYAGIVFGHWLSAHPDANRTEFLRQALQLARRGAASILPAGYFPWVPNPDGTAGDAALIVDEVIALRRALDIVTAQPGVESHRVAVVGHDYGAMYLSLLAAVDERVHAEVLMAPDATFSNWFDTYWLGLEGEAEAAYRALLAPYDPVNYLGHGAPGGILFEFSPHDQYVPAEVRDQLAAAAGPRAHVEIYANAGHRLNGHASRDREAFLMEVLRLDPRGPEGPAPFWLDADS